MKSILNASMFAALIAVVSGSLLYQCTSSPRNKDGVKMDFVTEQQSLSRELSELRNDIDRDLERAGRLAQGSDDSQDQISRSYKVLVKKKAEVETMLTNVNNATEDGWSKVRKNANYTLEDVRRIRLKLEKNALAQSN